MNLKIGPEKGVIHLATAAIVNAVWDLWSKMESKVSTGMLFISWVNIVLMRMWFG